jgi:hypothetical protein
VFKVPERFRYQGVPGRESERGELNGAFLVMPNPARRMTIALRCIASCGADWEEMMLAGVVPPGPAWEHVSVSPQPHIERTPTWEEMCYVKSLFWDDEDAVIQIHPPASEYVNQARYCLHLWRPVGVELVRPPALCVGDKVG